MAMFRVASHLPHSALKSLYAIVMQQCLGPPASILLRYIQTLPVSTQIEFGHLISSLGKKCFYKVNNRQREKVREG